MEMDVLKLTLNPLCNVIISELSDVVTCLFFEFKWIVNVERFLLITNILWRKTNKPERTGMKTRKNNKNNFLKNIIEKF